MPYTIELITCVDQFGEILSAHGPPSIFSHQTGYYNTSLNWVQQAWKRIEEPRHGRPFLLLIRRESGGLAGWWPLLISRRSLGGRLQGFGQDYSDYCTPFIHDDHLIHRDRIIAALLAFICRHREAFDCAFFPALLLPLQEPDTLCTVLADGCGGWWVERSKKNFFLDFQGRRDIQSLLADRMTGKNRKQLRYEVNRLHKMGLLRCRKVADTPTLEAVETFFRANYLHGADSEKVDLWFDVFKAERGKSAEISVLWLEDQILNVILFFKRGTAIDFFSTVYHQPAARLSPGKVHLYLFIEQLLQEGSSQTLHFLAGDEPYKQKWASGSFETHRTFLYHHRTVVSAILSLKGVGKRLKRRFDKKG